MKIRAVTSEDEFIALEPYWDKILFNSCLPHVQSTFEWLHTWWKYFGEDSSLFILVAEDETGIAGIAPLVIHKVGKFYNNLIKFKRLSFLGVGFTDHADFIIQRNGDEVVKLFFRFIYQQKNKWDEINLRQVNSESPQYPLLQNGMLEKVLPINDELKKTFSMLIMVPYVEIGGSFQDYLNSLSVQFKKQLQKYMRSLQALGELRFQALDEMDDQTMEGILKINRERNSETGRRSILLDKRKFAFICEVLPKLSSKGWLKVFVLKLNEEIITYEITFSFNNIIYAWNTSFSLNYSKYSPGRIIVYEIIKYCYENGYRKFDLMVGAEEYKFKWTQKITNNYVFAIKKNNLKTSFSEFYEKLKYQFKE